jgi:hypothetical protein
MHTIDTIETDSAIKDMNMSRIQLIDYLLDLMVHRDAEERKEAQEKLYVLCPNRG